MTENLASLSQSATPALGGANGPRRAGAPLPLATGQDAAAVPSKVSSPAKDRLQLMARRPADHRVPPALVDDPSQGAGLRQTVLDGARDGAATAAKTVAKSVKDHPVMVAGVVAGYRVLARTPARAYLDRQLLEFTAGQLQGYAAEGMLAASRGDHYRLGQAIGKGVFDLTMEAFPRALDHVADAKRSLDGLANLDDVTGQLRLLRRANVARDGARMTGRVAGTVSTAHSGRLYLTSDSTASPDKSQPQRP